MRGREREREIDRRRYTEMERGCVREREIEREREMRKEVRGVGCAELSADPRAFFFVCPA